MSKPKHTPIEARLRASAPELFKAVLELVRDMKAMSLDYQEGVKPFSCQDAEKLIARIVGNEVAK